MDSRIQTIRTDRFCRKHREAQLWSASRKLALFLVLFLSSQTWLQALDPQKTITQYTHTVWGQENGLPQSSILAIAQTGDGYLWLGTQGGLTRFDGLRFTVFNSVNTPEIRSNTITPLYADREGSLWFGVYGHGLMQLREGRFTRYTQAEGLPNDSVRTITEDRAGTLWVGTEHGLCRYQNHQFTPIASDPALTNETIYSLLVDHEGNLWAGTGRHGALRLQGDRVRRFTKRDGLADDTAWAVHEDRAGRVWIATNSGLSFWQGGQMHTFTDRDGLPHGGIFNLLEDQDANLWAGTVNGLVKFHNGLFETYTTEQGLSNNAVWALQQDTEGNLWVGTKSGLNRFRDDKLTVYTRSEGLPDDSIGPVYEDPQQRIWAATSQGLAFLDRGHFFRYKPGQNTTSGWIASLAPARGGGIWVGTSEVGVGHLSFNGSFLRNAIQGLPSSNVSVVYKDTRERLWIGMMHGGLAMLQDGRLSVYNTRNGLADDNVFSVYEDREGRIWAGTNGGLSGWAGSSWTCLTTREGLSSNKVRGLYEDHQGVLWIGTNGGGLNRLKDGRITRYGSREGLASDTVYSILEDDSGQLWMSSANGVFAAGKQELNEYAEGKRRFVQAITYGAQDGLRSDECSGGVQPGGWKAHDGRLWFPTAKGLAVIDPNRIRINRRPPIVHIEQFLIDGKPAKLDATIEVPAAAQKIEFQYTGISLTVPERVRFRYRLEGFDPAWTEAGTERSAVYTNLPPGLYRFRVTACNNDGVWNETGAALSVQQQPHFYQNFWFRLLCAALAGLTIWSLYQLRMRQVRHEYGLVLAERTRIARELHDTLLQGFTGLLLHLQGAVLQTKETGPVREALDSALEQAREQLREARQAVWNLRSEALEKSDLAGALRAVVAPNGERRFIVEGAERPVPAAAENALLRITQEALANVRRHAQAQSVEVHLCYERHRVGLVVRDDGRGFDPAAVRGAAQGHFGLQGMRERVEEAGGRFTVWSAPGQGTEIQAEFPLQERNGWVSGLKT